jgi:hypothetical protein
MKINLSTNIRQFSSFSKFESLYLFHTVIILSAHYGESLDRLRAKVIPLLILLFTLLRIRSLHIKFNILYALLNIFLHVIYLYIIHKVRLYTHQTVTAVFCVHILCYIVLVVTNPCRYQDTKIFS